MARLVGYFLFLSLVTTGFMGYITFQKGRKTLTDSIFERLDAVATVKADTFNLWMDEQRQEIVFLSSVPSVRNQLTILSRLDESDLLYQENFTLLAEYMHYLTSNPASDLIKFLFYPSKTEKCFFRRKPKKLVRFRPLNLISWKDYQDHIFIPLWFLFRPVVVKRLVA